MYFVEGVNEVNHILPVIHYTICGAVCFQFTHFPWDEWENIHFVLSSSNRKYELFCIVKGLGHETMVCAVCLSIFLWFESYYWDRGDLKITF